MGELRLKISFCNDELLIRNNCAGDLKRFLAAEVSEVSSQLEREVSNTMDMGAILAIVLGSASITALARGIGNWIQKNNGASIIITMDGRHVEIKNVKASDVHKIIESFLRSHEELRG